MSGDDHALRVLRQAELLGDVGGERIGGDADEAARDGAGLDQAVHDAAREIDRDGEADADVAVRSGEDGGVDADEPAAGVDERAAGVARVDGGVGLDEILVAGDLVEDADAPAGGGDDAHGDGLADAERVADGEDHVAHAELVAVGQGDGGQVLGLDLDDGDVGLRIGADDLGGELAVVVEQHLQLVRPLDDVVVGDDVAVGGDDDAGAEALLLAFALLALTPYWRKIGFSLAHDLAGIDGDDSRADGLEHVGVAGDDGDLASDRARHRP